MSTILYSPWLYHLGTAVGIGFLLALAWMGWRFANPLQYGWVKGLGLVVAYVSLLALLFWRMELAEEKREAPLRQELTQVQQTVHTLQERVTALEAQLQQRTPTEERR